MMPPPVLASGPKPCGGNKHITAITEECVSLKSREPITELLAFTVCKLEFRGKAIVPQSRSRRTRFNLVNYGQNETKATSFARTKIGSLGLHVAYCCFYLEYHTQIQMTK